MIVQQKKLDAGRLHSLQLEGNSLSFTSRIKEKLKDVMSGQVIVVASATEDAGGEGASGGGGGKKRGPKGSSGDHSSAGGSSATSGLTSEQWAARINSSCVDECASSDEEDIAEQQALGTARESYPAVDNSLGGVLAAPLRVPYVQTYYPINPQVMAAVPDLVWPPPLQIPRRRPPIAASATGHPPQGQTASTATASIKQATQV